MKWSSEVECGPAPGRPGAGEPGPARPWVPATLDGTVVHDAVPLPGAEEPGEGRPAGDPARGPAAALRPRVSGLRRWAWPALAEGTGGQVRVARDLTPACPAAGEGDPAGGQRRFRGTSAGPNHTLPARPTPKGRAEGGPGRDLAADRRRARRWLARARKAAAAHLARARQEAEALRRQAWEEGWAQGEAAARARWEAACRGLEEQLTRQREALEARYRQLLAASAEPLLELALAIARRVAGDHLAADVASLRRQVEDALARLGSEGARVLVHPESLAQLEGTAPLAAGVQLVADLTLAPGDFRVETPRGQVDGRVAVQVERLGKALREQGLGVAPAATAVRVPGPDAGSAPAGPPDPQGPAPDGEGSHPHGEPEAGREGRESAWP
ncbi:Flagellar assembly protein FliH/Type III secretion system HrpE [Thermaerobacter marianensis DSM 12885]|uniref:Flagellar assembly protein FliH/Type III secretion system HrpE n=1 Tax=Thermaerobacter marianensis (strain ATCC 700841 / DSM 12885 / JCM 10246 / 7p75a) TaxID=644966 RepID=E6SJN0_THEM7|nr:flagellar assembly protein FliH/type III secretion system HrpE [Thermaerobacter marianensis]ADU51093.1 Flagellar assembly protein FliH/Type III secretion system HrpE [Thermaerobacter marianensis DSM 12885]